MELLETIKKRRSIRIFTEESVSKDDLKTIVEAGLRAPTGHGYYAYRILVVTDREKLDAVAACRNSAKMLLKAPVGIVVLGNTEKSDTWIEDTSLVLGNMQLAATDLDLGSCWVQINLREAADGTPSVDIVRKALDIPAGFTPEAVLVLGHPAQDIAPHDDLHWELVEGL
ncbi:nitroreductase family protein [Selenomonas sp. TAMA-11512]|uniref:nitroreductase family protein n=1 Tax=Selenomonas sp. TAMA-11512 TaxID=3095337 RepID=UPI00308A7EE0|nr:nitroreductase family protein [Selenomonas sp. TAMA-11512]